MNGMERKAILDSKEDLIKEFKELLRDRDFYLSITTSTTTDTKVTLRFKKVFDLINKYLPKFNERWRDDN